MQGEIQGDPIKNLLFQMDVALKISISDPMLQHVGNGKMGLRVEWYILRNFAKRKKWVRKKIFATNWCKNCENDYGTESSHFWLLFEMYDTNFT